MLLATVARVTDWRPSHSRTGDPIIRDEVDIGGRFPGREKREVRFGAEWLPGNVLQPNASYDVELRVGNASLPKSYANETVHLPALPEQQAAGLLLNLSRI